MPKNATARLLKPRMPKSKKQTPISYRGKSFTMDDSLWTIVGLGKSSGPADVSVNKDRYLADAYDRRKA